jgi:glycogen phosphorylase
VDHRILGITNGVHGPTWIGDPIATRLKHLGADLADLDESTQNGRFWERIERVPGRELWDAHLRQKRELAHFARGRLRSQFARHGEAPSVLAELERALDPDVLTIGFARRFATYKRASLIFSDMARLKRLFANSSRPVQIVFSGKAHPADRPGQEVLRQVHEAAFDGELKNRVVFIEDYDINVGRHLVQGVDVWLNNPRRPQEASGTSGQKVLLNGGLNFSVLDGWWAEAYDGLNGFAIGDGITHVNVEEQDRRDASSLYDTLENQIIPLYYERDDHGVPRGWIERMKRTIRTLGWRFNTDRMVIDYANSCYLPAAGAKSSHMR